METLAKLLPNNMPFTIPRTTRPRTSVEAIPNKKINKSPFTWYYIYYIEVYTIYVMMKSNNGRARATQIYTINGITCDGYERISKQFGRIMIITAAGCVIFSGRYGIIIIWCTSRDDIEIYCFGHRYSSWDCRARFVIDH